MSDLSVKSGVASYTVRLASIADVRLDDFGLIVVDEAVEGFVGIHEGRSLMLKTSESMKTMDTVLLICREMQKRQLTRESRILAIGGGVIQDLVTMSASIYHRGISWTYMPTTLASMVDSCIGGKSSINLDRIKNVLGNFFPPAEVIISTEFLETLDQNQKLAGLSEAVKINFARGKEAFSDFLSNPACLNPQNDSKTKELVFQTLTSKAWFIEIDEFDKAERQLLNFGHTFGHALEAATKNKLPHGLAVCLGMLSALHFSGSTEFAFKESLTKYCLEILRLSDGLIAMTEDLDWTLFKLAIGSDKKSSPRDLSFILPDIHGGLHKISYPKSEETLERATMASRSVLKGIGK